MIEVKPMRETLEPKITKGKSRKTLINESMTYVKNQAKWKAAREFCEDRKLEFKIMTEKELESNDILQNILNKVDGQVSEDYFRSQLLEELGSTNFDDDRRHNWICT